MPTSQWMLLFERVGFAVERYQELQAPESASGAEHYVSADWARAWPAEQVWHLRKI